MPGKNSEQTNYKIYYGWGSTYSLPCHIKPVKIGGERNKSKSNTGCYKNVFLIFLNNKGLKYEKDIILLYID